MPMASACMILPLLTLCSPGLERGLRSERPPTKAWRQTRLLRPGRKNTLPSSRHRSEDSFWSRTFPRCLFGNHILAVYGTGESKLRGCNRVYFRLAANERAGSGQARFLPLSSPGIVGFITEALVCLATRWERRSMRRDENAHVPWLHRQTKQCGRNLSRLRSSASSSDRPISAERYHRPRTLVP